MMQAELIVRGTTATLQDLGSRESNSVAPLATEALRVEGVLSEGDIAAALTKHAPRISQGNEQWGIAKRYSYQSQLATAKPKKPNRGIRKWLAKKFSLKARCRMC